jgi:hypothetical protein
MSEHAYKSGQLAKQWAEHTAGCSGGEDGATTSLYAQLNSGCIDRVLFSSNVPRLTVAEMIKLRELVTACHLEGEGDLPDGLLGEAIESFIRGYIGR